MSGGGDRKYDRSRKWCQMYRSRGQDLANRRKLHRRILRWLKNKHEALTERGMDVSGVEREMMRVEKLT